MDGMIARFKVYAFQKQSKILHILRNKLAGKMRFLKIYYTVARSPATKNRQPLHPYSFASLREIFNTKNAITQKRTAATTASVMLP